LVPPAAAELGCSAAEGTPMSGEQSDSAAGPPGDRLALRAADAAGLGVGLLPVVANLYSVWLLLRLWLSGLPVSPERAAQVREAWRLNALILGGATATVGLLVAVLVLR
jgi:hypothetical protein